MRNIKACCFGNQSKISPLNCLIYRKALTPGSSIPLKVVLKTLTGDDTISTDALKEYYDPLTKWLQAYLIENKIDY